MVFIAMGIAALAAVYTASYGWWAWQQKYYLGAIGAFLVALAALALPLVIFLRGEFVI